MSCTTSFIRYLQEMYTAHVLDVDSRTKLEHSFPPKYPDFIGHHITMKFGVSSDTAIDNNTHNIEVVGYADDGKGLEALVVSVDGEVTRPDGKKYHITWSLDRSKGYKPVDSALIIQTSGYSRITPIGINTKLTLLK